MESHEDIEQEVLRLFTQPLDELRHRIACVTDGHVQVVTMDYVLNCMLLRYCEGPGFREPTCYEAMHNLGASRQSHFRMSRCENDQRVTYYPVALPGSPFYCRVQAVYELYARRRHAQALVSHGPATPNNFDLVGYKGDKFMEVGMVWHPVTPLVV